MNSSENLLLEAGDCALVFKKNGEISLIYKPRLHGVDTSSQLENVIVASCAKRFFSGQIDRYGLDKVAAACVVDRLNANIIEENADDLRPAPSGLTARQLVVLDFIKSYIATNRIPPTISEIATGVGVVSRGSVHSILKRLRGRGHISFEPNKARSITVISSEAT